MTFFVFSDTPLMFATRSSKEEVVEVLLQHLADKTIQNKRGETAIDFARELNNKALINMLSGKLIL